MSPPPVFALAITLAIIAAQRLFELLLSARHERALVARGGVEFGRSHFLGFVLLHTLYPIAMAFEVATGGARPPAAWPALLAVLAIAQALRFAAMHALRDRWHTRVWVVPGEPRVTAGLYRWLPHPNYVAVVLECAALPLLFGAWRTAIAASVFNAGMLAIRLRVEERALRWAADAAATPPPLPAEPARPRASHPPARGPAAPSA